jgi:hypothetical protein
MGNGWGYLYLLVEVEEKERKGGWEKNGWGWKGRGDPASTVLYYHRAGSTDSLRVQLGEILLLVSDKDNLIYERTEERLSRRCGVPGLLVSLSFSVYFNSVVLEKMCLKRDLLVEFRCVG